MKFSLILAVVLAVCGVEANVKTVFAHFMLSPDHFPSKIILTIRPGV